MSTSAPPALSAIAPWSYPGAQIQFDQEKVIVQMDGKTRTVATDTPALLDPLFAHLASVSPNGQWLLYVTARDHSWQQATLKVVNLTSLKTSVIARFPDRFWPQLRWSPDSQHIAYVLTAKLNGQPEIYVMDTNGSHARKGVSSKTLTKSSLLGYENSMFGWSADGQSILYYDDALHAQHQYGVSLASGNSIAHPLTKAQANTLVSQTAIPSTPCNAPIFKQSDPAWANNVMQPAGDTIGGAGCAVSSSAMLVDYYAGSSIYDPATMNTCMGNNADPLVWAAVQGCSQGHTVFNTAGNFDWGTLNNELNAGHPPMVGLQWTSNNGPHWFLVVSGDGSNNPANYEINDPAYGTRHLLSDFTSIATLMWIRTYSPSSGSWPACQTGGGSTGGGGGTGGGSSKIKPAPTLVTYSNGTHTLFALGNDGHMWWSSDDGSGNWNAWNWDSSTNYNLVSTPVVVTYANGRHTLFAPGSDGHMFYKGDDGSGNWNAWNWDSSTDYNLAAVTPTLVTNTNGTHTLFALGSDGHMFYKADDGLGNWNAWNWDSSTDYGLTSTPVVVTYANGRHTLFAPGSDGHMFYKGDDGSGNWNAWNWDSSTDYNLAAVAPTLVTNTNGTHTLFALGSDGHMFYKADDGSGNWNAWNWDSSTNYNLISTPAVVTYANGRHTLFAPGTDGHMFYKADDGSGNWNAWNWDSSTDYGFINMPPTVVSYTNNTHILFVVGSDHHMFYKSDVSGSWNNWNWESNIGSFAN